MKAKFDIPIPDQTIIETLQQEFSCPTCNQILCHTVLTECGSKICRYCLISWLKEKKNCPVCGKKCQNYRNYPKIDTRIAVTFQKVGLRLRDERQAFVKSRKILELKFDLNEQVDSESEDFKESTDEEYSPGRNLNGEISKSEFTSSDNNGKNDGFAALSNMNKKRPAVRRFRPGNVQPNPFKKQLDRNSTGSLRGDFLVRKAMITGYGNRNSKTILKSDMSSSVLAMRTLFGNVKQSTTVPNLTLRRKSSNDTTGAVNDERSHSLSAELNNYYQRYIAVVASKKFEFAQKNGQMGKGDQYQFQPSVRPSIASTVKQFALTTVGSAPQILFEPKVSQNKGQRNGMDKMKMDRKQKSENDLLVLIHDIENYLKEIVLAKVICDSIHGIQNEHLISHEIEYIFTNVLELECFLQKRVKENILSIRDQETQTDYCNLAQVEPITDQVEQIANQVEPTADQVRLN